MGYPKRRLTGPHCVIDKYLKDYSNLSVEGLTPQPYTPTNHTALQG